MWFNVDKISQIFLRMKKVCSSAQNVSLKRAKPFSKMNYKSRNLFVIALIFSFTLLFYTYYSKNILVGEFLFRSKPFHHLSKSFEKQFYLPPESEVIIELRSRLNLTEPGYMGQPVILPKAVPIDIQTMMNNSFEKYKFNEFVSQLIPLDRELPDFRTDQCKTKQYSENLPKVSVILSFYNEPFSMLMRTVYSILFRSPEELLEEILLVDDCSDDVNLLVQLREVLPHLPIVKIIRSQKRLGLMQARVFGAKNAKGPILIVMDSHMEVTTGWLPPLLDPHVDNHAIVTMPMVEVFDKDTLQYKGVYSGPYNWVGSFTWELMYTWTQIEKLPKRSDVPLRSPTMLGAIFVIRKSYFEYLGYYDEELDLWGGENMELSFKVWMCHGKMLQCFCSHSAHMFRARPYWNDEADLKKLRNTDRVAEVWLDEYKIFYQRATHFKNRTFGSVEKQKELRRKLECNSFKWYLENVIPPMKRSL